MLFLNLPPLGGEYWVQRRSIVGLDRFRMANPTAELNPRAIWAILTEELRKEKSFTEAEAEADYLGAMYRVVEEVDGFETDSDPERRRALRLMFLWDFACDYLRVRATSQEEKHTVKFRALHWALQDLSLETPGQGNGLPALEFRTWLTLVQASRDEVAVKTGVRFFPREDEADTPLLKKGRLIQFPGSTSRGPGSGGPTGKAGQRGA